jgi:hypothetical protein
MAIPHYQPAQGRDFKQEFYFMADEVVTDFEKAKQVLDADLAVLGSDAAKVKAWYKDYPFYAGAAAGCAVGVLVTIAALHFL